MNFQTMEIGRPGNKKSKATPSNLKTSWPHHRLWIITTLTTMNHQIPQNIPHIFNSSCNKNHLSSKSKLINNKSKKEMSNSWNWKHDPHSIPWLEKCNDINETKYVEKHGVACALVQEAAAAREETSRPASVSGMLGAVIVIRPLFHRVPIT